MQKTIPKIIHYVWVGGKEKPIKIKKCMKTWEKKYPEYKIVEWNENNFNINCNEYVKKAYEMKKWAFVSDYIRMYAIYNYGGIYFDTDVIAIDTLDDLLFYDCFVGYESDNMPFTAVFGAKKGHHLIKKILDGYNNYEKKFDESATNTILVSDILINDYKCKIGNQRQVLKDNILVLPKEYLCEPSMKSKTIHAFSASWCDVKISLMGRFKMWLRGNTNNKIKIIVYSFFNYIVFMPYKAMGSFKKKVRRNNEKI